MKLPLDIAKEVLEALAQKQPVVALESTIISHGMPYPQNVETALSCEAAVRKNGAIPATIAILGGRMKAGLNEREIEYLAKTQGVIKTSRRDLPYIIASGKDGAATVAATMIVAQLAGIRVFATGGIGGVHRGAPQTFDISADIEELSRTDVAVVCAGVKSILDIGLTLEMLETRGVPVYGYQATEFPAFYTRSSGFGVDAQIDTPEEMAQILEAKWTLGLRGGVLIANPIPPEHAMPQMLIDSAIERALAQAEQQHICGKEITPFLLSCIKDITGGKSLAANIRLVENNAAVAARVAAAYAKAQRESKMQ